LVVVLGAFLFVFLCLRLAVKEQVHHDLPWSGAVEGATEVENLTSQQPVDETNGELTLVVAWDSNIDVLEGRVGVAKGDGGDVHVGGLA
jgi:hypothetical protein